MVRENGYYWVKFEVPEGKWTILKWSVDRWWGGEYTFIDNDFEAIDERRIIDPDEQSNCNLPHVSNNEVAVCGKKNCNEPVYEFGLCFKHYCISEE